MDAFDIKVGDSTLTVKRKGDTETYNIYLKGEKIAVLMPVLADGGLIWKSDSLDANYTNVIGKLIEDQL